MSETNGLPYYKAYPRDFIEGTLTMPFEVKCAYRVLLDMIYLQNGRLPDDARYIAGILGCSVRKWNSIRQALVEAGKIAIKDGIISNFRADKEIETSRKFQEKQRENASGVRKNKDLQKPRLSHTDTDTESYVDSSDNSENNGNVIPADAGSSSSDDRYAFCAKTIRLTGKDLGSWRSAYPHISLEAELWALDPWATREKAAGRNWFHAVANALAKREREMVARIHMARASQGAGRPARAMPDPRL